VSFANWSEALPFALAVGCKYARKFPVQIDAESVIMEALWRAEQRGAELTRGYVWFRTVCALKDEARRMAEGERGNYQSASSFVDVDERWDLAGASSDPVESLDRARTLERLPPVTLQLVTQLVEGGSVLELARSHGVNRPTMTQVLADLKAHPTRPPQLPARVDFFAEMRRAHREMVRDAHRKAGTVTGTAVLLGCSVSDASRWVATKRLILPRYLERYPAVRTLASQLVTKAFRAAKGSPSAAARLLGVHQASADALGRRFVPELVRSNRRPDLTVQAVIDLRRRGWSLARIANHCGVGETTIKRRLDADPLPPDLPKVHKRRPDLPNAAFAELKHQGLLWREIADRLGVSMNTVAVRLRKAGETRAHGWRTSTHSTKATNESTP
jgi:DNA-directed RNA polymerase specialized sigma24 family protein